MQVSLCTAVIWQKRMVPTWNCSQHGLWIILRVRISGKRHCCFQIWCFEHHKESAFYFHCIGEKADVSKAMSPKMSNSKKNYPDDNDDNGTTVKGKDRFIIWGWIVPLKRQHWLVLFGFLGFFGLFVSCLCSFALCQPCYPCPGVSPQPISSSPFPLLTS